MLITTCAAMAHGQNSMGPLYSPYGAGGADTDAEWFSPVDFDFDNNPYRKSSGYFFRYDKLSWGATSARTVIGDPNVQVLSEIIIPDALATTFNISNTPLRSADFQYTIINGLQDVSPTFEFGWGERYEFGHFKDGNGWAISILDGPAMNSFNTFGNGPDLSGFGSIHVNFATPENFLLGFRDYWGTGTEMDFFVLPTETLNGPGGAGDGIVDDLDGDGAEGAVFFVDADDVVVGIGIDLDDLHQFNVTYNQVNIRNKTETQGVEIMRTIQLSNRHQMAKRQNSRWEIGYGLRLLRLKDTFGFDGSSDLIGRTEFVTEVDNQIVGPQFRAKWSTQRGKWNLGFDARCLLGYNFSDADQSGSIGLGQSVSGVDDMGNVVTVEVPGVVPGGINNLLAFQPTSFSYGRESNEFSPTVEIRADASYQLTSAIAIRLGYTGTFIDNISRASQVTRYYLPDMGLLEGGNQDIFVNGGNLGFDVIY